MNQIPTIILGGGFVGLFTALHLAQQNDARPIILVEQNDRFTFKPLLYELLTGEMHMEQICPLYTDLLKGSKITIVRDTVKTIDLSQKRIVLTLGQAYDYGNLVIALGSKPTYFNTPGAAENALPFATANDAMTLKMRLQDCLQTAVVTKDPEQRSHLLTVAIIGAGPAGVELACTLADLLPVWYDALGGDYEDIRIVLVNRSNEILKGDINSRLRQTAKNFLSDRTVSVELLLDAAVTAITPMGVEYKRMGKADFLPAMTVVWTGGTEPHPLLKTLPVTPENRNKRGQLQVLPTLQLRDFSEVFVGGDCSYVSAEPQPATAQVAYQQGKAIAYNLKALAEGRSLMSAQVNLRGTLMKLGIGEGVANIFDRVEIKGELGHLIRQGTYLELLPIPIYNFKTTAEWFTDGVLQRHQTPSLHPTKTGRTPLLAGLTATLASFLIATPLIWRAAQPEHFQKNMESTGLPTLMDQLVPETVNQQK
ncbi:NAD(P)/FAD-dependent oxidoreductase [Chroococcus sp. FPU101]|uniref:NAD(P)/FAD-dependent oxidoreductase n=1 Tax=Chroococcus sp. FPU101 TaxID=1974212 RepID=UPI001A8E700E|nr:NAD(P)/FAD-dependent oxidoreductase [Chroococcus sp. FPU101]GFE69945.1 probable NADH dehydrogenase [Chroococcus sp. FPU101]